MKPRRSERNARPLRRGSTAGRSALLLPTSAAHSAGRIRALLCQVAGGCNSPCARWPSDARWRRVVAVMRAMGVRDTKCYLLQKPIDTAIWGRVQGVEINPATASVLKPLEASKTRSPRETHKPPCQTKMILTTCPACAAPLAHDAPRCVRCQTRYCNKTCLGDNNMETLRMEWIYAEALYKDASASLDDLREAVTTLEETARIARRVMGGAHPLTAAIGDKLRYARAILRAREAQV